MRTIHQRRHPTPVEGCFGCRIASVQLTPSATPTRRGGAFVVDANRRQAELDRNRAAYKALRRQGYQPPSIDQSGFIEATAEREEHVTMGQAARVTDSQTGEERWIRDAAFRAYEDGFESRPTEPNTDDRDADYFGDFGR